MNLEQLFFNINFSYNVKLVEKLVANAQSASKERRKVALKHLVFKMMKNIVSKNILNYLNLLKGLNLNREEMPDSDDLIGDCYMVYDHCIDRYIVNAGYNFYFYFNKALSRNFFRLYTRAKDKLNSEVEMEDVTTLYNRVEFSTTSGNFGSVELLIELLQFNEIEIRICKSRMSGQKNIDFLNENKDISNSLYNNTLRIIKDKLIKYQEQGEI